MFCVFYLAVIHSVCNCQFHQSEQQLGLDLLLSVILKKNRYSGRQEVISITGKHEGSPAAYHRDKLMYIS